MKELELLIGPKFPTQSFRHIATDLMNNWILIAGDNHFRIAEIEFYMRDDNYHKDVYVHGHELQKTSHRWYYHGSGIDLTFGNNEFYGGILLRALCNIGNDKYTYGPLQILTEIFGSFPGIHDTNLKFGLIPDEAGILKFEEPIAAPRIGLNPKHDLDMASQNYRFLIMPKRKHADKTGIVKAMEIEGIYTQEQINAIWG